MEAILKFNLSEPEDLEEFELASNARKYHTILWELDQYLRGKVKYPAENAHNEYTDAMDEARTELWKLLNEHNLDLNS